MNYNNIKLIILDIDGTLTDGGVYIDSNCVETKKFNIKDGAGIVLAQSVGIEFMFLTGRTSACVEQRAKELKIKYVAQGIQEKAAYLKDFMASNNLSKDNIVYIGDDLNDLPAMHCAGISVCPADAADEVKRFCNYILSKNGGEGAVREFIEILLKESNLWEKAVNNLFPVE
jgi:3-deoxy-D-manno-octulosonate 8-phosphate phosphatase (KDO 8-P phosphatase)